MEDKSIKSITGPELGRPGAIPAGIEGPPAFDVRLSPAAAGPPRPSTTPDAIRLLRAFQRRWRIAIGLGVLGAALAGGAAWCVVPTAKYTAEAVLLVEPEQPKLIAATKEYRSDPDTDRRTQLTLIKSPIVLGKALGEPEVAGLGIVRKQRDPSEWLEHEFKAEFAGKILRLALTGDNATEVATLVKAVTGAYLSEVANKEKSHRLERNEILKRYYDQLQERLEGKRARLRGLATEVGSNDKQTLSLQQRLAVTRQGMAEQELLRTQSALKQAMAKYKVLQARAGRGTAVGAEESTPAPEDNDLEQAIQGDTVLQGAAQRVAELEASLAAAKRVARNPSDASILTMRRQINDLRDWMKQH
jgi:polysaccharide biosynthesis transport protein